MGGWSHQLHQSESKSLVVMKFCSYFFQTRVCVSLEPKTSNVKLVVDGETIVDEVRIGELQIRMTSTADDEHGQ